MPCIMSVNVGCDPRMCIGKKFQSTSASSAFSAIIADSQCTERRPPDTDGEEKQQRARDGEERHHELARWRADRKQLTDRLVAVAVAGVPPRREDVSQRV